MSANERACDHYPYESSEVGSGNVHSFISIEGAGCGETQLSNKHNFQITDGIRARVKSGTQKPYQVFQEWEFNAGRYYTVVARIKEQNETLRKYKEDNCRKQHFLGLGNKEENIELPELAALKNWSSKL